MTTETQAPAVEPETPPEITTNTSDGDATADDNKNKLALDAFSEALGDDEPTPDGDNPPSASSDNPSPAGGAAGLEALYDIPVNITVVLGRTSIEVTDLLALGKGDIVELDRKVGEAIDIFVNNRLVARGEVVLVNDRLGITMTEIIKGNQTG